MSTLVDRHQVCRFRQQPLLTSEQPISGQRGPVPSSLPHAATPDMVRHASTTPGPAACDLSFVPLACEQRLADFRSTGPSSVARSPTLLCKVRECLFLKTSYGNVKIQNTYEAEALRHPPAPTNYHPKTNSKHQLHPWAAALLSWELVAADWPSEGPPALDLRGTIN